MAGTNAFAQGFSPSHTQWNIPANTDDGDWKLDDSYSRHNVFDLNGDGKPDLIDSENEATTSVSDVFVNGSQKYWKVYLNTGSGFSTTFTQWNIPTNLDDGDWKFFDAYSRHQVMDFNGDGLPDFIDSEDEGTTTVSDVFLNGSQKYWKVYLNTLNTANILSATLETSNVLLYPNPCANEFKVKVDAGLSDVQVLVINALGETVSAEQNFSNNIITVKLNNLSSGVYFVQLLSQQIKTQPLKLVVNN